MRTPLHHAALLPPLLLPMQVPPLPSCPIDSPVEWGAQRQVWTAREILVRPSRGQTLLQRITIDLQKKEQGLASAPTVGTSVSLPGVSASPSSLGKAGFVGSAPSGGTSASLYIRARGFVIGDNDMDRVEVEHCLSYQATKYLPHKFVRLVGELKKD